MDYKTGSYLVKGKKIWTCKFCKRNVPIQELYFSRVEEYGETFTKRNGDTYREKNYNRYHIECALTLSDLNTKEKEMLQNISEGDNLRETKLKKTLISMLQKYENLNLLTYLPVNIMLVKNEEQYYKLGRKGFSDLILFLNNGMTIFIEVKTEGGQSTNNQIERKNQLLKLNHKYHIIHTTQELWDTLNKYINIPYS